MNGRPQSGDQALDHGGPVVAHERTRVARGYLLIVRPAVLAILTVLTIVAWLGEEQLPAAVWVANAVFWGTQLLWLLLLRRGVDPRVAAGASLLVDAAVEYVALFGSPAPAGASSAYAFFAVGISYFLGARATMAFVVVAAAGITVAAQLIPTWGEDLPVPSTAFVTLITGGVSAFIMSRVRHTERRLEQLTLDQRASLLRLEQVDRARDRLIANVSHELRTPLTSTIGAVETLLREDVQVDEPTRMTLLRLARDGGLRLLLLVEDLLTLGATRPDSLDLSTAPERLASLVHDAVVGIDPGEGRAIRVEVHDDPPVRVDRMRILQVVSNLVVNGVRHGSGEVCVETDTVNGYAVIRVLDDGHGVAPEHLDELFLPFARFSSRPDSTGLGLAICRTLVEAHGGSIRYGRTIDERTTFTVSLPVDRAAGADARREAAARPVERPA